MFDRYNLEPIYNTRAVVQRTGVPADTFRAWERRYGVPSPSRTEGNQRLYSERDIAIIGWLRDQTAGGLTISQAIALMRSQEASTAYTVPALQKNGTHRNGSGNGHHHDDRPSPFIEARRALVDALIALDGTAADRIVEEALALTNLENVCVEIMQGALVDIGHRWEQAEVGVGIEHFASAFVQRKFAALFNQSNPHEGRGPIVAACPEGEQHELGLLLTCLFLSRRGYKIVYLGANMPLTDLVDTCKRIRPPLVLLSASRSETAHRLIDSVPALKAALDGDATRQGRLQIGFGGFIFSQRPELRLHVDGVYLGSDAREAVRNVDRIVASMPA